MSRSTKLKLLTFPPRGLHQPTPAAVEARDTDRCGHGRGAAAKPINSFDVSFVGPAT